MWLAEMGADVIRIHRPGAGPGDPGHVLGLPRDVLDRGRDSLPLDLKSAEGQADARRLIGRADALIEGLRPGAMERLGLGPDDFPDHPSLVYGRMTGWGQTGPMASVAGHDITYLALSGMLHPIGPADQPLPPLNLVGDFGGGGMYLIAGMLAALIHARRTGQGQVVDAAIVDGAAHLGAMIWGMAGQGAWADTRATNALDGAAPWYTTYACADDRHMAVGAIEPKFWAELLSRLEIDPASLPERSDRANWPAIRAVLAARFADKSRDDWAAQLAHTDACAVPVLSLAEAPDHPHNRARGSFTAPHGYPEPAPAPRLSVSPGAPGRGQPTSRLTLDEALARWV